jgi:hypothetical protein
MRKTGKTLGLVATAAWLAITAPIGSLQDGSTWLHPVIVCGLSS